MKSPSFPGFLALVLVVGPAVLSPAQVITPYSSLSTFTTAIGAAPVTVEDFGSSIHFPISTGILNAATNLTVSNGAPITPGLIQQGVTYSTAIGTGNFFNIDTGGGFTGGFLDTVTSVGPLNIAFNGTTSAFGFDTSTIIGSSFSITINFTSGGPYTNTFAVGSSSPTFFGFQGNASNISSIVLGGGTSTFTFAIDNFRFINSNVASIPEPGTAGMIGLGLATMAALHRGRRRRALRS